MTAAPGSDPHASIPGLEIVDTVEGWLAVAEAHALAGLAAAVPGARAIVEIGNYRGRSTVALALGARSGGGAQVYTFDPHTEFVGPRGGTFGRKDQAHLYANLARAGVGEQVSVVTLDSRGIASVWPGPEVGLLFVDGDHREAAVRADIEAWYPALAADAVVCFDDVDFPDIARVVAELVTAGRLAPLGGVGKIAWFGKRTARA